MQKEDKKLGDRVANSYEWLMGSPVTGIPTLLIGASALAATLIGSVYGIIAVVEHVQ